MDSIEKLSTAITLIEEARGVPLSASCVVHRGEILEILDGARIALPQDLSAAEAILVQRDNLIEEGKIAIRNIRRDGIQQLNNFGKDDSISEDVIKDNDGEIQKITDNSIEKLTDIQKTFDNLIDKKTITLEAIDFSGIKDASLKFDLNILSLISLYL